MKKAEKIESIKKRFKNEWLLIRVDQAHFAQPLTGWLLEHNPLRMIISKKISKYNSKYPVFITFSQDRLPKGYAAAFSSHA